MIIIKCKYCKKKIKTFPCRIPRKNYCSHSCRAKDNPAKNFIKGHKWFGKLKNNGIRSHSSGYITVYSPFHPYKNKRNEVLKHRLVMEKHLKRFLLPTEIVHHKNGNKKDNRLKNIILFSSQSKHIKHHRIIKKLS
jgi:hypothetical protein